MKVRTIVRSKRASKSRPTRTSVNFYHEMTDKNGDVVTACETATLMRKRPEAA